MTTFATVDELQERLDWTLEDGERGVAAAALEDLTEWACHYGRPWTAENAPRLVVRLVLSAAARYMRNVEGLEVSRAGDETVQFQRSQNAGTAAFTDKEARAISKIANPGTTGFHSLELFAHNSRNAPAAGGFVPVENGEPFPFFADDESPW